MQFIATFFLFALPWLNPFAPGPSPAIVPLFFSWSCVGALIALRCRVFSPLPEKHGVSVVAWAWLAAGLLSSAMGLYQYFDSPISLIPWINQARLGEAFANLRQRNQFASLTNIALVSLIWFAAVLTLKEKLNLSPIKRLQGLSMLAAVLLAFGNAASSSRTGMLQLLLICGLCWTWGLWRQRLTRRVLLTAIIAYVVATLALPWLAGFDLFQQGMSARLRAGDSLCSSRLTLWSNVLHLITQKPWLGWGWGELDYAHYITLYEGPRFCEILDNAHNLPLHLAVELGLPLSLAICGSFTYWVLQQKPWRELNLTRQLAWSVLAVILLHSLLEYPLWYGPFQIAFGLCLAMLWSTRAKLIDQPEPERKASKPLSTSAYTALLATISIACIAYAGWDYRRISQIYLSPELRDAAYRSDTLNKIRSSWLFATQVRFAELNITPLTSDNAEWVFETATAMLHYSPEPRVIEKVIESSLLLRRNGDALMHMARYRAAFPVEYAQWERLLDKSHVSSRLVKSVSKPEN